MLGVVEPLRECAVEIFLHPVDFHVCNRRLRIAVTVGIYVMAIVALPVRLAALRLDGRLHVSVSPLAREVVRFRRFDLADFLLLRVEVFPLFARTGVILHVAGLGAFRFHRVVLGHIVPELVDFYGFKRRFGFRVRIFEDRVAMRTHIIRIMSVRRAGCRLFFDKRKRVSVSSACRKNRNRRCKDCAERNYLYEFVLIHIFPP